MKKFFEFICEISQSGKRLDIFLFEKMNDNTSELLSRNRIKSLIENQCVEKDDKVITSPSVKTILNSKYRIHIPPPISAKPEPQNISLDIIYEDKDIIVVNKPAGMVVHPGFGNQDQTLVNALLYHCKGTLSGIGGVTRPGIVHRIDKDTSGILVSAKNDYSHLKLSNQFKEHSITRSYLAIVWGVINKKGILENNISRHPYNRKKMHISKNGKVGITHWELKQTFSNIASLIECNLKTGRTHQIRVQFANNGNHLIGDKVYNNPKTKKRYLNKNNQNIFNLLQSFPRQALHAKHLSFLHPITNKKLSFESELPEDISKLIDNFT
tara:strand:+ start:318 stop:1292 length:975 start_codon:yes stop_codon:yes gene_type:complete